MIPMDEAYKHLGIWRRADGITTTAIERIKERFRPALRRLSRLRKPTLEEFMVCSEGLLGSLGGFYFQTVYFPLEETDKIEASWRRIFNRKFGGTRRLLALSFMRRHRWDQMARRGLPECTWRRRRWHRW